MISQSQLKYRINLLFAGSNQIAFIQAILDIALVRFDPIRYPTRIITHIWRDQQNFREQLRHVRRIIIIILNINGFIYNDGCEKEENDLTKTAFSRNLHNYGGELNVGQSTIVRYQIFSSSCNWQFASFCGDSGKKDDFFFIEIAAYKPTKGSLIPLIIVVFQLRRKSSIWERRLIGWLSCEISSAPDVILCNYFIQRRKRRLQKRESC